MLVVTCNHCPYVIAWNKRLRRAAEDYAERGVRFLGINANDASRYPADSLEAMQRFVRDQAWPYPYLHDEDQSVARALGAEVTPHVFVLDGEQRLAYRGAPDADHTDESLRAVWLRDALDAEHRLVYRGAPDGDHHDDSRDAEWLRAAVDAALAGTAPDPAETRARGCSVKWRG